MTETQLVECLEPIEKRYKQDYSTQERKMLYKQYAWMTDEMFGELCGLVLAVDRFRIPAVEDFSKIQRGNLNKFRRVGKALEPCELCKGTGARRFLQKCWDKKHIAPAARCNCPNGKNWAQFPSVAEAEKLHGFARWIGHHESDFGAVIAADLAVGVDGDGERVEDGADDNIPPEEERER